MLNRIKALSFVLILVICSPAVKAQSVNKFNVIAYFSGKPEQLEKYDPKKISHIIFCFGHLKDNKFNIGNKTDSAMIRKMVDMKKVNPQLKVLVSLGGWGGCKTCSDVFSAKEGRREFAESVKKVLTGFKADGIDLDWEYPAIEGFPEHKYSPEDKNNFTELVKQLRETLGKKAIITFAAGGFQKYLDESVDWKSVMRSVDLVNLMSYDLINGYAVETGHHTALYSTPKQVESTDNAVKYLINKAGVDPRKIIIGAAFYARIWENVPPENNGLYQPGKFKTSVDYKKFPENLSDKNGFEYHWDDTAKAPYMYNRDKKLFATFDDKRSIALKTEYVMENNLGGIMFWELGLDTPSDGLLDTIIETGKEAK
ncbi:glycoside hydrolase family 18 protein [Rubrolithibacter danxiaensis]|uniref:glycoside hydrolase family 18 protein n=1 Tax=Rubrolithibacter danxiaensis TaxID=3390805 RepID=UPI003BF7E9ED